MKTKVLLIVLLVGAVCLAVYGRRAPLSHAEERARQKQRFEQDQILRQQRLEHYDEKRQSRYLKRLKLLEARVTDLEHALATKVSHVGVPSDLQDVFDAEITRRSNKSKAEIQRAVHSRVLGAVKPLSDENG